MPRNPEIRDDRLYASELLQNLLWYDSPRRTDNAKRALTLVHHFLEGRPPRAEDLGGAAAYLQHFYLETLERQRVHADYRWAVQYAIERVRAHFAPPPSESTSPVPEDEEV